MKLRNKKTGEILRVEFLSNWQTDDGTEIGFRDRNSLDVYSYNSLAELNADWEDYEEPKRHWFLATGGKVLECNEDASWSGEIEIGNYFETKEEAEKAVEKLKAWKRLKDKGFKFEGINMDTGNIKTGLSKGVSLDDCEEFYEDMILIFGGEV